MLLDELSKVWHYSAIDPQVLKELVPENGVMIPTRERWAYPAKTRHSDGRVGREVESKRQSLSSAFSKV